jgi:hypothetical protein
MDGTPPLEGLRPLTRADNGNLSDLKKHDLLVVEEVDPDNHKVHSPGWDGNWLPPTG